METINLMNLDGENILSLSSGSKGDVLNKISKVLFNKDSAFNNGNRLRFRFNSEDTVYPLDSELFHQCFVQNEITVESFLEKSKKQRFDNIEKPYQRGNSPFEHEVASRFQSQSGKLVQVTSLNGWLSDNISMETAEVSISCGQEEIGNIRVNDIPALVDALNEVLHQSDSEIKKINAQKSLKYIYNPSILSASPTIASA